MRTYKDMIEDYLLWYYKRTGNKKYQPHIYLDEDLDPQILEQRKGVVWKEILTLCYGGIGGIYWFFKFILGDLTYAGYPMPIRFNKLWWDWSNLAKKGDHICIKCSRQHGKSTYWTVIQTVFRTSLYEHYNVLIESATEEQATMLLGFVEKIIYNNEFLMSKRSKSAKWSTTELHYNGGKIVGKGIGSEVRGGTYDYIILDDILRSDNKLSDSDIENFIDEEIEPMILVRNGQIIIVGTPKSATDIFSSIESRIRDGSTWKLFEYPAITDWNKKRVLCPDRFTWPQLMNKRRIMGSKKFEKEFLCKTYSSGSQLFPDEIRKLAREKGREYTLYPKHKPEYTGIRYYIGVDCARAGSASADYTVVTVLALDEKTMEKRIVWVWREKGLKTTEQVEKIANVSARFEHPLILVEQNNLGQDFIDILVDNYSLNIEAFTTSVKTKEDLIRFLINAFENEKIIIPQGNEYSREVMQELDQELERFVDEIFKGSGHSHDDMVISLALANRCTQIDSGIPSAQTMDKKHTSSLERYVETDDLYHILKTTY